MPDGCADGQSRFVGSAKRELLRLGRGVGQPRIVRIGIGIGVGLAVGKPEFVDTARLVCAASDRLAGGQRLSGTNRDAGSDGISDADRLGPIAAGLSPGISHTDPDGATWAGRRPGLVVPAGGTYGCPTTGTDGASPKYGL